MALAAILVAWATAALIPFPGAAGKPAMATHALHAEPRDAADTEDGKLSVRAILADGRSVRLDQVDGADAWHVVPPPVSGVPPTLRLPDRSSVPPLRVEGRDVVAVIDASGWQGTVRLTSSDRSVRTIAFGGNEGTVLLDNASTGGSLLPWLAAVAVLGGWTWWMRPWRRPAAWLAGVLGALHLVAWLGQPIGTSNDSIAYLYQVDALVAGIPQYFPPGYPAFLGVTGLMAGPWLGSAATLVQHGMIVLAAIWVYHLLGRLVAPPAAVAGALVAGAWPSLLTMPQSIMTESVTLFAMVGAVHFALLARENGRRRDALLSGLLAGWAGLLRVVPLAALGPALLLILWPGRASSRRAARWVALSCATVLLLPMAWFWARSGSPALATSTGLHVYNRVVVEEGLLDTTATATRELQQRLVGTDPRTMPWWDVLAHPGVASLDDRVQVRLLGAVAVEGALSAPFTLALSIPALAWRELIADSHTWIASWGESTDTVLPRLENPRPVPVTAASLEWRSGIAQWQRRLWPLVCLLAGLGVVGGLLGSERALVAALAWAPTGYLLASASLDYYAARHNVPPTPFLLVLSVLPLAHLPVIVRTMRRGEFPAHASRWRAHLRELGRRAGALAPQGDRQ